MSTEKLVDITKEGTVILGPDICCDGFSSESKFRVQSHIHDDHMHDFELSIGWQSFLVSPATLELLKIVKDSDVKYRGNVIALQNNEKRRFGNSEVTLISSGHMLGAVQTHVILDDGKKVGYSGDFYWPLEKVIHVDTLVVDSTYGNPETIREYDQNMVHEQFAELLLKKSLTNPIKLRAFRGTLECALDVISSHDINIPIVADDSTYLMALVHQTCGYSYPPLFPINSDEGRRIIKSRKYIYICNPRRDNPSIADKDNVIINLSAFMVSRKEPILKFNNLCYKVALTRHADFNDTIKYVEKTGATKVITDNTRGPYAIDLAMEIESRLGVEASPSTYSITDNMCRI
jgi:putative mRNA 3-end processing factor